MAFARPAPPRVPPAVARRAVEWLVELQAGPPSAALRTAWERWRAADPDHELAWQHVAGAHAQWRDLASPAAAAAAHAVLARPESAHRRRAVKTLVLCVGTAGGLAAVAPWDEWLAGERTAIGERRTLRLPGGGTIALNGASALDLDAAARQARLAAGEILVTLARSAPLALATPHGTVRALGGRFAVRLLDGAARVAVFDGAVDIAAGAARTRLGAGWRADIAAGRIGPPARTDDGAVAWADGMLLGGGMRLADFLAELARYRRGTIACDGAVADLRVAGTYLLADTDRVLRALAAVLPIEVAYFTRYYVRVGPRR